MSQHNDILKFEIAAGIVDRLPVDRIIQRIQGILEVQEWDQDWVDAVPGDSLGVAKSMRTQRDGLYGVTHQQLDQFMASVTREYNLNPVGFN
jgi:hypothetical protein